ncbi:MAG: hypothetical protein ACK5FE_09345 [Cyanobacteriota bacterium]
MPRFFPGNRRDGSRLLSSLLVISGAGLVRVDHPAGRAVFLVGSVLSLLGWIQYRKLQH